MSSPCDVIEQQSHKTSTESSIFKKLKLSEATELENNENIVNLFKKSDEEETCNFDDLCFDDDEDYCTQVNSFFYSYSKAEK